MKHDWDIIREVLIEVEALDPARSEDVQFGPVTQSDEPAGDAHALLLWKAGFIEGVDASSTNGDAVLAQGLSWAGHELLETIRSEAVWERINATAKEKGIELSFDAVKALGRAALEWVIAS